MTILYLLIFLTSLEKCFSQEDRLLSFPITHTDSPVISLLKNGVHPRIIEKMIQTSKTDNGTIPVALYKLFDNEFYTKIKIGTTKKYDFNVVLDTTWGGSWVISDKCKSVSCQFKHTYKGTGQNMNIKFKIPFGASNMNGTMWKDLILLNNKNVTDYVFGSVEQLPSLFSFSKSDGVLGLALTDTAFPKTVPIFFTLFQQGLVKKAVFSFYLNRDPNSLRGGTVFMGGTQPRHYKGNFTYVKILPPYDKWAFKMENITIGKKFTVCKSGCNVILDTGSSLIGGPEEEIDGINQFIEAQKFYFGRYSVVCSRIATLPAIKFSIGGKSFVLKGPDYVQTVSLGPIEICLTTFTKSEISTYWTLGGSFISTYYTTFDVENRMIGFATSL